MADIKMRLGDNVPGDFFVDSTCINCDTCRQLAPETFAELGDYSFVYAQPQTAEEKRQAMRALLACPTGSIGTQSRSKPGEVMEDFPLYIEGGVYYSGFNSAKSYGGNSYFIHHSEGNWLIDSPKYVPHLVRRFHDLGGIRYIFLTHRDDVAEARRYALEFASRRIIHRAELSALPGSEMVIEGHEPVRLSPEFLAVPTPGHTRGHCVLLYRNRYLFSGDHLRWSRAHRGLTASRSTCWYSWSEQVRSMARLLDFGFEWLLPGHGQRVRLPADQMREELVSLVNRMREFAYA